MTKVGFCLARSILIVPLMVGAAPYGFLGKFQAITVKRENAAQAVAAELLTVLAMHPETQERAMPCVLRRFITSSSFDIARESFALLDRMPYRLWDTLKVCDVEDAIQDNPHLRDARLSTDAPLPDAVEELLSRIGITGHLPLLTDMRNAEGTDTPF